MIGVLGWLRVDLNAKVLAIFLTPRDPRRHHLRPRRRRRSRPRGDRPATRSTRRSPSAPGSAPRSASRWPPSSASSRRRSTARSARTRAAPSPGRPTSRSGSPRSSTRSRPGCSQSAVGPDGRHRPGRAGRGRLRRRPTARPRTRPRSCSSPSTSQTQHDDRRHRDAALLHQPVRRIALVPQRGRALLLRARAGAACSRACSAHPRATAPRTSARSTQTLIAAVVIGDLRPLRQRPGAPALHLAHQPRRARRDPAAGAGLVRVVGYFSRHPHGETAWTSRIAPALAGMGLTRGVRDRALELQPADHRAFPTRRRTTARSSCRRSCSAAGSSG